MSWRLLISALVLVFSFSAVAQTGLKVPKAGTKPPASSAQPPAASTDDAERAKIIERIFECLASGLPQDWWRAWAEFVEKDETAWNERSIEGRFFYLTNTERTKPQDLKSCDAKEVAELTYSLNQFLDPDKRRWKIARLEFGRDGSFELKYDYTEK
jgi:hypothetical protein